MTGAYSRNKGARSERELCALLREYLGVAATRNLKQYQQAQCGDIEQLIGPYMLEAKNHKTPDKAAWWRQAQEAARVIGALPCVAYRLPNRTLYDRWRFLVPDAGRGPNEWWDDYRYTADLGLDAFAARVREHL